MRNSVFDVTLKEARVGDVRVIFRYDFGLTYVAHLMSLVDAGQNYKLN